MSRSLLASILAFPVAVALACLASTAPPASDGQATMPLKTANP